MRPVGQLVDILQRAGKCRLLHDDGDRLAAAFQRIEIDVAGGGIHRQALERQSLAARDGACDLFVDRVDARCQQNPPGFHTAVDTHGHQRGLGQCRCAVVKRRIADVETRELGDHRLVFVNRLQRTLARLGLVRRVGAVVLATRCDVPDGSRNMMLVSAGADETQRIAVHGRTFAHQARYFHLGHRIRHTIEMLDAQLGGDLIEEFFNRVGADRGEHLAGIFLGVGYERHRISLSLRVHRAAAGSRRVTSARPRRCRRMAACGRSSRRRTGRR